MVAEVLACFVETLRRQGNELVNRPDVVADLGQQVRSVIDDVVAGMAAGEPSPVELDPAIPEFSAEIGANRANGGIAPADSLRAATTLFEVTLPVLTRELRPPDTDTVLRISRLLHNSIMVRVSLASVAYVAFLMEKLAASRQEERRRIARELHDRVLHGMGLALQGLDLHRHYTATDPDRARDKLDSAVLFLGEAVRTVQHLSAELRRSVGDDGLERALRAYLEINADPSVRISITTKGDARTLGPDIAEELYLPDLDADAISHKSRDFH